MAGRAKIVRSIQSYVNHSDANSGLSMLKAGTPNKVGNTQWTWYPQKTQCAQGPLDFVNTQAYYKTLNWQLLGNNRPSFVSNPRQAYTSFPPSRYPLGARPSTFSGNYNAN